MTKLERIEKEIEALDAQELRRFREWFEAFDAARWDSQIEADAASGKLDALGEKAITAHRAGRTRPL
ncbi:MULTISPECIES: hypothetical protein [Chelativorans]|uniref:hypothetical protein n=1 Tax=Chelativorans TaxID=449972 RepID=UPI00135CEF75|nr:MULTISPECIES: hypothetical protein [Chelativorans]